MANQSDKNTFGEVHILTAALITVFVVLLSEKMVKDARDLISHLNQYQKLEKSMLNQNLKILGVEQTPAENAQTSKFTTPPSPATPDPVRKELFAGRQKVREKYMQYQKQLFVENNPASELYKQREKPYDWNTFNEPVTLTGDDKGWKIVAFTDTQYMRIAAIS